MKPSRKQSRAKHMNPLCLLLERYYSWFVLKGVTKKLMLVNTRVLQEVLLRRPKKRNFLNYTVIIQLVECMTF